MVLASWQSWVYRPRIALPARAIDAGTLKINVGTVSTGERWLHTMKIIVPKAVEAVLSYMLLQAIEQFHSKYRAKL